MKFDKNLFLLLIFCNLCISQKMDLEILHGIKNPDLVGDTIRLEKNTFQAFKKMRNAAKKDGIDLKIVSSYRSYERQKLIWNNKFIKYTQEFKLKPEWPIRSLARIDIIDGKFADEKNVLISEKFMKGGIFFNIKKWLDKNSAKFGFYITYDDDPNRKGFEYEPWHFSYYPISKKMLSLFLKSDLKKIIKTDEIKGSEYFTDEFIEMYKKEYLLDINKILK